MDRVVSRTIRSRWAGAVGRRLRCGWRWLREGRRGPPVEAAWRWLADPARWAPHADPSRSRPLPPALAAALLETGWLFGLRELASRQARWLVSLQRPDGAIPAARDGQASLRGTSAALRAWLRLVDDLPELEGPARRAAETLDRHCRDRSYSGRHGQRRRPRGAPDGPACLSGGRWPAFGPLYQAGVRWSRPDWIAAACEAVAELEKATDLVFTTPPPGRPGISDRSPFSALAWLLHRAEENAAVGREAAARELLGRVEPYQWAGGAIRAGLETGPVVPAHVAWAAALWYRFGLRRPADRAMAFLQRTQRPGSGFPAQAGNGPGHDARWAVKYYLDAAWERVQTAFDTSWADLPRQISPEDGRVETVLQWFAGLGPGPRVADVGCGTGRFLRHLLKAHPQARLTGIDICQQALDQLPPGVTRCRGSLLRIPAGDGAFDAAYAVESIEHALVPQQAVAEMCRIVRPGGRLLVIDKDRAKQPLSEHQPWERWFRPDELARWLRPFCQEVTVRRVSHSEGRPGRDLFLAAAGTRRG